MNKKKSVKDKVLQAIDGGMSISDAAKKYEVSRASIYTWRSNRPKDVKENPELPKSKTDRKTLTPAEENERLRSLVNLLIAKNDMLIAMLTIAMEANVND